MFLDADDMFEDNACEIMYNNAEEKKADYISANYVIMDEFDKKKDTPAFDTEIYGNFEIKLNDLAKSFMVMNCTMWNKIYNLEFLNKNKIRFDVKSPSEDDYFATLAYMKANKGYYINNVIYDYRHNPNSTSNICDKKYFKKQNNVYKAIYSNFRVNEKMGFYRYYYAKKSAYLMCKLIDSNDVSTREKKKILKQLKWFFSLGDELMIFNANKSLIPIFQNIKHEKYRDAIKQMETIKKNRTTCSIFEKNRTYFPTLEQYAEMSKYDYEFEKKAKQMQNIYTNRFAFWHRLWKPKLAIPERFDEPSVIIKKM